MGPVGDQCDSECWHGCNKKLLDEFHLDLSQALVEEPDILVSRWSSAANPNFFNKTFCVAATIGV
jgi:hypothetical protein